MDLHFQITNIEDIEYLNTLDDKEKNNILKTAISIGLKSINMAQLHRDGLSYMNPIKELIKEENNINSENIRCILDILQDTLRVSSKKGRFGELMAINLLIKKYPSWKIEDTAKINHSGDCSVFTTEYGKILYELKTYTSNVGNEEISKFKRDIFETNSDYGIFISQTSGIVGKSYIDYELYENKILVYICNTGLNGIGIEIGTELLISLIKSKISDKRFFVRDLELEKQIKNINDKLFDLKECITNFSRLKSIINDTKSNILNQFDILYKICYESEIKGNYIFNEIIENINIINNTNEDIISIDIDNYISTLESKYHLLLYKLNDLCKENNVLIKKNDNLVLVKNGEVIGKILLKTKIEICFTIKNIECVCLNLKYEKYKNDMICITLINDENVLESVSNRLK